MLLSVYTWSLYHDCVYSLLESLMCLRPWKCILHINVIPSSADVWPLMSQESPCDWDIGTTHVVGRRACTSTRRTAVLHISQSIITCTIVCTLYKLAVKIMLQCTCSIWLYNSHEYGCCIVMSTLVLFLAIHHHIIKIAFLRWSSQHMNVHVVHIFISHT